MSNKKTREQIEKIIISVGFDPKNDFSIGKGAEKDSEIRYKPYTYMGSNRLQRKEFFIQFCNNIVAVWEVGKRFDLNGSKDMYWNGSRWKDIRDIRTKEIKIQGKNESTVAAVMPLDCLEPYLMQWRQDKGLSKEEIFYINTVKSGEEGNTIELYSTRYERDSKLRKQAIEIHGTKCQACGFSFADKYGPLGVGFIEVHHTRPISEGPRKVDPRTDMVCLCSNCHRMIHHKEKRVLTVDELKTIIKERRLTNKGLL